MTPSSSKAYPHEIVSVGDAIDYLASRRAEACGARRMAETAALLADHVLPFQPARQWVLSLPFALRYLLATRPEVAESSGFSLHAGIAAKASQRDKTERLARYASRPPVAAERLSLTPGGNVRYALKTPYRSDWADSGPSRPCCRDRRSGTSEPSTAKGRSPGLSASSCS